MTRARWRNLLTVAGWVPRFVTIGEPNPQTRVQVFLERAGRAPRDVTHEHVVASLKPLTLAMSLPGSEDPAKDEPISLRFAPVASPSHSLGRVWLSHAGAVTTQARVVLQLFRAAGYVNHCLRGLPHTLFALNHRWAERRQQPRPTFFISRRDLGALQVVYACPRPVVLVSVAHEGADNLFPMDLIGSVDGHILLALRNTSPSIPLMTRSRRMALANVPLGLASEAQRLGVHHKKIGIDWSRLPFKAVRSPAHGLPVPDGALGVRDLGLEDTHVIGSHTLFITRLVAETSGADGLQMTGISGSYYRYLRLRGEALAFAPSHP